MELGVGTREVFWTQRLAYVSQYAALALYPDDYGPDGPVQNGIYGQIDWTVGWLPPALFYVENPYLLVTTNNVNSVVATESATFPTVRYEDDCTVIEHFAGIEAQRWFEMIYNPDAGDPGTVQLTLVNARDAGFLYASVPPGACENVDTTWAATGTNAILGGLHTVVSYFYHHGKYGVNNLSPDDLATRLALIAPDARTRIEVALWRSKPSSATAPGDLTYVIEVEP